MVTLHWSSDTDVVTLHWPSDHVLVILHCAVTLQLHNGDTPLA